MFLGNYNENFDFNENEKKLHDWSNSQFAFSSKSKI